MSILGNQLSLFVRSVAAVVLLGVGLSACDSREQPRELLEKDYRANAAAADTADPLHVPTDSILHKVQEVKIRALGNNLQEIRFSKDTLEVMAGALVKLKLENEGIDKPMIHNIVITKEGQYKQAALEGAKVGAPGNYIPENVAVIAASSLALPGQTVEVKFQAPLKPVTYDFVCTYPEHYQQMHGKIIVK
ncbi:plastocyanin/azurin family copper-binding protein [Botryobacter ruber]|uniref:plastocyanin/azurin family copper-binding protein n=1 Tax=Botryobacter ruber TaxID=2171629 RepID=UPI001F0C5B85|nr:plastocyanin/azurin family copper-binding protein [Botryobacter ruber]